MKHVLEDVGDVFLWAAAVMLVIWVIQYSVLAPWWRHFMGITIVGEALVIVAIYIPSLMALADPAAFANFAGTTWYLGLAFGIVTCSALFIGTRIVVWEYMRRLRGRDGAAAHLLPSVMAVRITELETENAALRARLGEDTAP